MISIIINIFNEADVIQKTLTSIFNQNVKDIEVIMVNDGSTDNLDEIIEPWLDKITYIKFEKNKGRQVARNVGIDHSKGEYLFVCDADISMKLDCLEKMLAALHNNQKAAYAYAAFTWGNKTFTSFPFDAEKLKKMNYINMASLVRKNLHPRFDEKIGKFQEWDVWLTLLERGYEGVYVPEILFSFGPPRKTGLSVLLPRFMYKIPWEKFGIHIRAIEQFEYWKKIVQQKHGIT